MAKLSAILLSSGNLIPKERALERKQGLPPLHDHQIVRATVTKVLAPRQVQLQLLGRLVQARTYLTLEPNQEILLQYKRAGSQPLFKLLEATATSSAKPLRSALLSMGRPGPWGLIGELKRILGRSGDPLAKELQSCFDSVLSKMAFKPEWSPVDYLRSTIQQGGLAWENKLARCFLQHRAGTLASKQPLAKEDLKALAMQVIEKGTMLGQGAVRVASAFLNGVENYQLLNSAVLEDPGRLLLSLPMLNGADWSFGQLLIDDAAGSKNKTVNERTLRLSMLLTLSNLGDVRAEMMVLHRAVSGTFYLTSDTARTMVKKQLPVLLHRLRKQGFNVSSIRCRALCPEILARANLIDELAPDEGGCLNLIV